MEYQKLINLLANTPNHPSKIRTKNWVEENDRSHGTYSTNSKIKFKTSMLRSSLCEYSDPCILVSGTITITEEAAYNLAKKKKKNKQTKEIKEEYSKTMHHLLNA